MTDERQPESTDKIDDLDVPVEAGEDVKGGVQDGTSNTVLFSEVVGKKPPAAQITR